MESKQAIILGASGLVGSALTQALLQDEQYHSIIILTRRPVGLTDSKITEHIIDFDQANTWKHLVQGDVLFSAFGTTIKKAGSQATQYKIDFTYQYETAKAAANNGVKQYILVSSAGANSKSKIFYSRMKGELDDSVKKLPFNAIHLLKPSVLAGNRTDKRLGEKFAIKLGNIVCQLPFLRKYRPITDYTVAKAMINAAQNKEQGHFTHSLGKVHELAK